MEKSFYRYFMVNAIGLIILFSSSAQSVFDKYENKTILKNNIKKKTHWVYGKSASSGYKSLEVSYNRIGVVLEETTYRSNGRVSIKRNYKYDNKGNVIEYQSYDGQKDKITYKKFIKYDSRNNKLSEMGFDGVDRFDNKYSYDARGRLQEIRYYTSNKLVERREIKYNAGQEILVYRGDNSLYEKIVKKYDTKGNLISDAIYSASGNEKRKTTYKFGSNGTILVETQYYSGNMTEKKSYVYEGNKLSKIYIEEPDTPKYLDREYIYDDYGRLVTEKWIDKRSKKYSTKSYKYDSKGNASEIKSYFAAYNFGEDIRVTYNYY